MSMTSSNAPACVRFDDLFLHPLLEDPASATNSAQRSQQHVLEERAKGLCASCPMLNQCRYNAVVKYDVSGFVAATTQTQRAEMRRILKHRVAPEDLDTMVGAPTPNRQVDHNEVLRLRNANPHETLDQIAERLGCSLSTVKRHLRKARSNDARPVVAAVPPTLEQVNYAAAVVTTTRGQGSRAA